MYRKIRVFHMGICVQDYHPIWNHEDSIHRATSYSRSTLTKSVMISVGVSTLGSTELIFIEPGAKTNGAYYRDVLLHQYLPAIVP